MCGAPRKGPSTWCSKLGRENPASDASGCSCKGHPLVPITARRTGLSAQGMDIKSPFFKLAGCLSDRIIEISFHPRDSRLRGRRHGHLHGPAHGAEDVPDAKLLSSPRTDLMLLGLGRLAGLELWGTARGEHAALIRELGATPIEAIAARLARG
jgi:hypothetical protein